MPSGFIMAAQNVLDFRENFPILSLSEKNITGNSAQRKTCRKTSKNTTPILQVLNYKTSNQAFDHDLSKIIEES